jgi:hypothetical protein
MTQALRTARSILALALVLSAATAARAQQTAPFEPKEGLPGKDVVWVPTPPELVERMLDLAGVTADDVVVDLGSGDGRNVIAAARRGARALGVEYNPDLVEVSKRKADAAGVSDKASFVQGDMYQADFQHASVLALFLLPDIMEKLRPKFLELRPGSRIVANTFGMDPWIPDEMVQLDPCNTWCTALLWIVPARVAGTWTLPQGELSLQQEFQTISGTLGAEPIADGRMRGDQIRFTVGGAEYTGRVSGDRIEGTLRGTGPQTTWTATRASR